MLLSVPFGSANLLVLSAERDLSAPSSAEKRFSSRVSRVDSVHVPRSVIERIQRDDRREHVISSHLSRHSYPLTRIVCEREMTMRDIRFLLFATLFFSSSFEAHSHPSRFTEDDNEGELVNSWPLGEALNEHDARRNEILEKLQQVRFFPSVIVDVCGTFVRGRSDMFDEH